MYFIHALLTGIEWNRCLLVSGLALLLMHTAALSQDKSSADARCLNVEGVLLKQGESGSWLPVAAQDRVPTDRMLVALFGADLQSANGAVGVKLVGDIGERGVFPIMESAVVVHKNSTADLDITLERGIVLLSNLKKDGPVHIIARGRGKQLEITLPDAKTRLAVEIYGRHVPGTPNSTDAKLDVPVTHVFFFALEGEPTITGEKRSVRLHAPPGTALLHWDSVDRTIETRYFEHLPEGAKPRTGEELKQYERICASVRRLAENAKTGQQLEALLLAARDSDSRKVAVIAMGALDDLPRLVKALNYVKDAELRKNAVLALRHWFGRESGQSVKLYEHLTGKLKYTPVQAKSLLHLLTGIEQAKLSQPGTYDLLIHLLNHSKLAVRELAHWHLVRLVPAGKSIVYDAAAPEQQRSQAIAAWRQLVPEGELPPPAAKKDSAK